MAISQGTINTLYTEILQAAGGAIAATGTITFSGQPTTAARATGSIALTGLPLNNDTVTVNGTVITWKTSGAVGNQVNIGVSAAASATALHAFLAASADSNISAATYSDNTTGTVTVTAKVWGTGGNAFTLVESSSNLTVSGATLSGGTNGNTVSVNGVSLQFIPASQTSPTTTDVAIGASAAATATLLGTYLNASANTSIDDATYTDDGAGVVTVTHDTPGTGGNAFTLAKVGTNIAVSGATLSGGANTGPFGQFNPVGSNTGEILVIRSDETFEDNCIAIMAVVDFILQNVDDPSASDNAVIKSKEQRKMLKDVLQALSAHMSVNIDSTQDLRTTDAARIRSYAITEFNKSKRNLAL